MGPGKGTHGTPVLVRREAVGGPKQAPRDHHHNDRTKVTVTRLGYRHGSGARLLKPRVHEATTELGDRVDEMIASDRIVDPLFAFVTSEYCWSANVERIMKVQSLRGNSTNSYDVQEDRGGESNARDQDRVEGGAADKSDKT